MIVLDVGCENAHRFEGWFADSVAFEDQCARGLIACPTCGSTAVARALSVPRIAGVRTNTAPSPREMLNKLAGLQQKMLKDSTWVGRKFATEARAMAEGKAEPTIIHGQATADEARSLHEDGVAVMPLLVPVVPPEERN